MDFLKIQNSILDIFIEMSGLPSGWEKHVSKSTGKLKNN